jgi:methylated-DNA-[protein]-cysteine S-methyltransferase
MDNSKFIEFESPVGLIRVYEVKGKITSLEMNVKKSKTPGEITPLLKQAKTQLTEYFAGSRTKFDLPVYLGNGTEFQKSVWKQIAKIAFGKTISYGDIAKQIGNPKAVRAVGGAVGSNPIPLIIPCHRVMGSSGKITGYSGGKGIPTKKWLLNQEGIKTID